MRQERSAPRSLPLAAKAAGAGPATPSLRTQPSSATVNSMARRRCVVVDPVKVHREGVGSRTMKPNEELWVETPLGDDRVTVYLDNVEFWADRSAFDAAVRPYSADPV